MEEEAVVSLYLCHKFSSILREAEKDDNTRPQMLSRFQSIQGRINDICNNNTVSSIPVELLYDVIDALSECRIFAHKAAASAKPFFRLTRFFFTKKMMRRLDDMETKFKGSTLHPQIVESIQPPKALVTKEITHPLSDTSTIIGLESEAKEIESRLMHKNSYKEAFTAIGIVGIRCGSGKTSLAQKVFSSPTVKSVFSPRIWVCLSNMMVDNGDAEDPRATVVINILKELGQSSADSSNIVSSASADSSNIVKLLEKVHSGLMGKRYLIVLDDAWEMDEWFGDLGYSLPRGYPMGEFLSHGLPKGSGGAVIVTSRWESVVKRMIGNDDMNVIHLENKFNDDICWRIFCHHSKYNVDDNPNIRKDVISICDGLPLAAEILGSHYKKLHANANAWNMDAWKRFIVV